MKNVDLVIIGGGPAGMSAAVSAYKNGIKNILILDRDAHLGGILQQCIHNGFGLHKFKKELTGPEYAWEYQKKVLELKIPFKLNTMVINVTKDKIVTAINEEDGVFKIWAGAVIFAMGCRERSRGALNIAGTRPAGVYTAGTAQRFINIKGCMPGKNVVILGSGDIGLIMARRMTLEGARVKMVCEIMPYSGGLTRNIVQCLNDFDIPLRLSHTVIKIHGNDRVSGVTVAEVGLDLKPIQGTEEYVECDTLLLSVGLIPENELSRLANVDIDSVTGGAVVNENRETSVPGIFACGNVLHVHDLVDFVSEESEIAGEAAAKFLKSLSYKSGEIQIKPGGVVKYVVPQKITGQGEVTLYFRVGNIYENVNIGIKSGDKNLILRKKQKVVPGEMETIKLTEDMIKLSQNGKIVLYVEEDKHD